MNLPDIDSLVADRKKFNDFVYTPLPEAIAQLRARQADEEIQTKVRAFLGDSVPAPFHSEPRVVLARHLVTPDHEVLRFLSVPDSFGIKPLFFEYLADKLIYKNPGKYRLARPTFFSGIGKKGGVKREDVTIVDFDKAHGKPINSIKTLWGQSLTEFHHALFLSRFPDLADTLFDGSSWYANNGATPERFYERYLALFVSHGILFENFFLDRKEMQFTKEIFLPAFMAVIQKMGVRPLIVALEPTLIEGDEFWLYHPYSHKEIVEQLRQSHSN